MRRLFPWCVSVLARSRASEESVTRFSSSTAASAGKNLRLAQRLTSQQAECFLLKGNQIDIAWTAAKAVVAGNDGEAQLSQIKASLILAPRSEGEGRCDLGRAIETRL